MDCLDNPTPKFLNLLVPKGTYKHGWQVCDIEGRKSYELLKGSRLNFDIKHDSPWGYEHALALKIGKVGAERLTRFPGRIIIVKTKTNVFEAGNHSTQGTIKRKISAAFGWNYEFDDAYIYQVHDGSVMFTLKKIGLEHCLKYHYHRIGRGY